MATNELALDLGTDSTSINENSGATAELSDEALDELISEGNVQRPWDVG